MNWADHQIAAFSLQSSVDQPTRTDHHGTGRKYRWYRTTELQNYRAQLYLDRLQHDNWFLLSVARLCAPSILRVWFREEIWSTQSTAGRPADQLSFVLERTRDLRFWIEWPKRTNEQASVGSIHSNHHIAFDDWGRRRRRASSSFQLLKIEKITGTIEPRQRLEQPKHEVCGFEKERWRTWSFKIARWERAFYLDFGLVGRSDNGCHSETINLKFGHLSCHRQIYWSNWCRISISLIDF